MFAREAIHGKKNTDNKNLIEIKAMTLARYFELNKRNFKLEKHNF